MLTTYVVARRTSHFLLAFRPSLVHALHSEKHETIVEQGNEGNGNVSGNCWERGRSSPRGSDGLEDSGLGGVDQRHRHRALPLEESDHLAVHCVHTFTQNLYHYATQNTVRRGERAGCYYLPFYLLFKFLFFLCWQQRTILQHTGLR